MKPLAANSLLQNRYLIIHHIGKGGMGEVYLAVDQRLGNPVALKRTVFRDDAMMWDAFEREARILARLRHSVLPKVSDHFSEREEQYLVMEYISGDDLSRRLEAAKKPFPLQWVLYWADELLDALNYLHTHEPPIVHRDIKPQNLKLTNENHVVLLDFGLAKNSVAKKAQVSSSGGSLIGYTPNYAPIEQIRGAGTNPRSDIYSLSATLYQLLTGTIPMDALTRAESVIGGMGDPIPSPRELVPEISAEISAVILRGIALNSEQRYSDAREMQRALREAYAQFQQRSETGAEPFDGAETVVPDVKRDAPEAALGGGRESYVSSNGDSDAVAYDRAEIQEPPETLTPGTLPAEFSATIPAEQWMQGETQGFSQDEIRRSTIDEDAFKTHGFDLDATMPMLGFDAGNGASSFGTFDIEPQAEEPAEDGTAVERERVTERPTPIRPVSKPLDAGAAKVKKASSGWGIKLVGIAAVLCLLLAVGGGAAWYAITTKMINIPGLEGENKQTVTQEPAPPAETRSSSVTENTAVDTSTQPGQTAAEPGEKEAQTDLGTIEGGEERPAEVRANTAEKKLRPAANPQKADKTKSAKTKKQERRDDIMQ
jgi:serine/threonine protein kinase